MDHACKEIQNLEDMSQLKYHKSVAGWVEFGSRCTKQFFEISNLNKVKVVVRHLKNVVGERESNPRQM